MHIHTHKTQKRSIEEKKVNRGDKGILKMCIIILYKWKNKNYFIHQQEAGQRYK